jgi:hypothetical protein
MADNSYQSDRLNTAFESIAVSLGKIAEIFERRFPAPRLASEVVDATVTHRQTEEERIREEQGFSEETDAEWIGRREARFHEAQASKARKPKGGRSKAPRSH